jgi:hypothetical protein
VLRNISQNIGFGLILWLRVFENSVLKRIFEPKRDEVTGECKRLHKEERNNLYSSTNIMQVIKLRVIRWAGHVARTRDRKGAYRILLVTHERSRPLGRSRHRWENNIKVDLHEAGRGVDWTYLIHERVRWRAFVNAVMNLRVP